MAFETNITLTGELYMKYGVAMTVSNFAEALMIHSFGFWGNETYNKCSCLTCKHQLFMTEKNYIVVKCMMYLPYKRDFEIELIIYVYLFPSNTLIYALINLQ